MFHVDRHKSLWPHAATTGVCRLCGDEFPLELGDKATTCEEWAVLTIKRLPANVAFPIILDLCLFTKLCRLAAAIVRTQAAIEVEGSLEHDLTDYEMGPQSR